MLGETPNWQDLVGAVLIIAAGILLLRLRTAGSTAELVTEPFGTEPDA